MTIPLKIALIGAGNIAQTWVDACDASEVANLVAVVDTNLTAAQELSTKVEGCRAFSSMDSLLDAKVTEAVVIATPPSTHPELFVRAAACGLHGLCEKPLSIDVDSARRMNNAATRAGTLLTMASKFRFVPDIEKAKELIDSGLLGELQLFENVFTSRVDMRGRWNSKAETSGGGVLIDNGTHSLDITRYFLGPITHVQAIEGPRVQGLDVEESVHLSLLTEAGVMGNIDLSWSLHKPSPQFISIYGSKGTLHVGWQTSQYKLHDSSEWVTFGSGYDKLLAFVRQLDNFVAAIRGEEPLRITPADAIGSVRAVESAYRAMHQGVWEPIPELAALHAS